MQIRSDKGIVKWMLIGISALFLITMLVLPLVYVVITALRDGLAAYRNAVTDSYALKAIGLTVKVTVITVIINSVFGLFATVRKF